MAMCCVNILEQCYKGEWRHLFTLTATKKINTKEKLNSIWKNIKKNGLFTDVACII